MKSSKTIKSAKELPLADAFEVFADTFITDGPLKELPLAGTAIGIFKAFKTYKKEKFKEKLKGFIEGVDNLTQEEFSKFSAEQKTDDPPLFSEHILELIEEAESEQKAKIIGVIFRRLVRSNITRGQFSDQIRFVKTLYIMDIFHFMHGYHNHHTLEGGLGDTLASLRIYKRNVSLATRDKNLLKQEKEQYIRISYEITGIGTEFLRSLHDAYRDKINPDHLIV